MKCIRVLGFRKPPTSIIHKTCPDSFLQHCSGTNMVLTPANCHYRCNGFRKPRLIPFGRSDLLLMTNALYQHMETRFSLPSLRCLALPTGCKWSRQRWIGEAMHHGNAIKLKASPINPDPIAAIVQASVIHHNGPSWFTCLWLSSKLGLSRLISFLFMAPNNFACCHKSQFYFQLLLDSLLQRLSFAWLGMDTQPSRKRCKCIRLIPLSLLYIVSSSNKMLLSCVLRTIPPAREDSQSTMSLPTLSEQILAWTHFSDHPTMFVDHILHLILTV